MQPEKFFFEDDGSIPNNKLPLLLYRNAFDKRGSEGAAWLEDRFADNNWTNSWRNGVFSYHHYHSITHEVLGVYSGNAKLHLGGEQGEKIDVKAGDVIVIPAGVGHKNLGSSSDFGVVGAYPNGSSYDMKTGKKSEYEEAKENISKVMVPEHDPLFDNKGVPKIWGEIED
ncbi:MAG: cupin domain-containing protein [Balneolaceae bacterium]|nr:cupin domain-containing protein [Balneolaceae bacterium]